MSDKPEKIYAYPGSLIYSLKPALPHTVEYIRADLAKPSEWISVDDRLPEFGNYMVLFKNNSVMEFSFSDITETPYWFKVGLGEPIKENPITHWQHLPSPLNKE